MTSPLARLLTCVMLLSALAAPATVSAASDPAAGYGATWTVTEPGGHVRTDDQIAVGDDLDLSIFAVDGTAATQCKVRITAVGGFLMDSPGRIEAGVCRLTVRLPDFPGDRSGLEPGSIEADLCIYPMLFEWTDLQERLMSTATRKEPAGRTCYNGSDRSGTFDQVLDFRIEEGGTPRPFVSDPPMISWNPADWGTDMQPLRFGETWHWEAPAGIEQCHPYLNGEWQTVVLPRRQEDCVPWDVRLPGVLPQGIDWAGEASWGVELVTEYRADASSPQTGMTLSMIERVPIVASDGVFESSRPSIFPTDLARTRFVVAGERWQPSYQVSGGETPSCRLEVLHADHNDDIYTVAPDTDGICTFDVPPFVANEWHQVYVYAAIDGFVTEPNVVYGGSIAAIDPPAPPIIETPIEETDGETGIGVEPGAGQGLVVDLEVAPGPAAATSTGLAAATTAALACADRAVSTNIENGGSIPHLDASCALPPGQYTATAQMVDVSGTASTSTRTFTVLPPAPRLTSWTPAKGSTGVARDKRPSVTFDVAVSGVSTTSFRLRDEVTHAYRTATVTYDKATRRATLRPASLLTAGRTYRVYLTSTIKAGNGRPLLATNWTFRVTTDATRPTIVGRLPASGATGVSRSASVKVRFSSAVKGVSGTSFQLRDTVTGGYVAATVTYDPATFRAVLDPSANLVRGRTYQVIARSGIRDLVGNALLTTSWKFKTAP